VNGTRLLTTSARVALVIGWAALLLLGAVIAFAGAPAEWLSRAFAWLATALVVAWLASHLRDRHHAARALRRPLDNELRFDLAEPADARRRVASRQPRRGQYRHRSHGERPRFD
jgi:hypothetical protein